MLNGARRHLVFALAVTALSQASVWAVEVHSFGRAFFKTREQTLSPLTDHIDLRDSGALFIDGAGGAFVSWDSGFLRLESERLRTAHLDFESRDAWMLGEGVLEWMLPETIYVRIGEAEVLARGHVVVRYAPDIGSLVSVEKGHAWVKSRRRKAFLPATHAVRIRPDGAMTRERLLPPPPVVALPPYTTAPLMISTEIDDERTLTGAVQVEVSADEHFWENAIHRLFRPGVTLMLADAPGGRVHVRLRAVNRSGTPGPATRVFSTWVMTTPPRWTPPSVILSGAWRGRIDPPLSNVTLRWNGLRCVTDTEGAFAFHPARPLGISVSDLEIDAGAGTPVGRQPVVHLSDPDSLASVLTNEGDPRPSLFIRVPQISVRASSKQAQVSLDGLPLSEAETRVSVPLYTHRTLRIQLPDGPLDITLVQDTEGPRILNVDLQAGDAASEAFYVIADVIDLGIGLTLPARAVFENDAGQRLEVPLRQIDGIRLEGRASTAALDTGRKSRSRVWWIRIETQDLLGNTSSFETSLFRKRQKKFVSVGLKDLVHIWKNKL